MTWLILWCGRLARSRLDAGETAGGRFGCHAVVIDPCHKPFRRTDSKDVGGSSQARRHPTILFIPIPRKLPIESPRFRHRYTA